MMSHSGKKKGKQRRKETAVRCEKAETRLKKSEFNPKYKSTKLSNPALLVLPTDVTAWPSQTRF